MRHTKGTRVLTVQIENEYITVVLTKEDIEKVILDKVNDYLKSISYPEIIKEEIKFKDANSYPMKVESCSVEIHFNAT
jgi:hypothetical protein